MTRLKLAILSIVLVVMAVQVWAQRGQGWGMNGAGSGAACLTQLGSLPLQKVDELEAEALTYMREEEKLAHDVYVKLYAKWGAQAFGNITQAELRHMDALKALLDRYNLPDPLVSMELGAFKDGRLKSLYADLAAQGESSLQAAWNVGAIIEDLDIRDLQEAQLGTDNVDFKTVYANLERASRNHLRAYTRQLSALGVTYKNQYISSSLLAEILAPQNGRGSGCNGSGCTGSGCNGAACDGTGSGRGLGRRNGSCQAGGATAPTPGAGMGRPRL